MDALFRRRLQQGLVLHIVWREVYRRVPRQSRRCYGACSNNKELCAMKQRDTMENRKATDREQAETELIEDMIDGELTKEQAEGEIAELDENL